jgi:hypothetical protein
MERIEFKRVNLIESKRTKIVIEADACGVHVVSVEIETIIILTSVFIAMQS